MHPLYIFISIWNLLSALSFALLFLIKSENEFKQFLGVFSVFGGYFANLSAVVTFAILLVFYVVKLIKGDSNQFLSKHWLGLFNGAFVVFCWVSFFGYSKYVSPV